MGVLLGKAHRNAENYSNFPQGDLNTVIVNGVLEGMVIQISQHAIAVPKAQNRLIMRSAHLTLTMLFGGGETPLSVQGIAVLQVRRKRRAGRRATSHPRWLARPEPAQL